MSDDKRPEPAHMNQRASVPSRMSIPNLISGLRILTIPFLFYTAWTNKTDGFLVIFCGLLLMALADGFLARRLKQETELGAELDSWGVFATYLVVPLCALMLWPDLVRREASFVMAVVGFYFVPATLGLLKYNRLTSYHTWSSKASSIFLGGAALILFTEGPAWPFRIATPLLILSGIEEIFMTAILPQWRANVPSLWHAMAIEREKVEHALEESEKKYRTILANIEDGYFEVDLAGNLTFFNPILCRYLGYSKDELLGKNNREFMSKEQAKTAYETFNKVFRTGKTQWAQDWEFIRKDGTRGFFEATVTLIRDDKGNPLGFRCFGRDTSERKKAEQELRQHQEQLYQAGKMVALGTLVSGVAHDINNPNNFIMLNIPLLKEAWEGAMPILEEYYEENGDFIVGGMNFSEMRERIPKLFAGLMDGSQRIQQIVDDLKNFVRKGSRNMTESVDINQVIRSAVSLVSPMIKKSTHRFSITYGENLPLLTGNFHRLEQVIINLIQNACQALPDRRRGVEISTFYDRQDHRITIKIKDQGIGIPRESLPHITSTFFSTKFESGGLGLGLSISTQIIEEHGGRINFSSELDKGTTVVVLLPVDPLKKTAKEVSK